MKSECFKYSWKFKGFGQVLTFQFVAGVKNLFRDEKMFPFFNHAKDYNFNQAKASILLHCFDG